MDQDRLSSALAALGHPVRLSIYRVLVDSGPAGMGPVAIGGLVGIPHNLVNYHLRPLVGAKLAESERRGREVNYRAVREGMDTLLDSLLAFSRPASDPVAAERDPAARRLR